MATNPNYALVADEWAPLSGAANGAIPSGRWVELTRRTRHGVSIKRGKQYELDQAQAGEYSTTLENSDGALDPLNSAGPWAGNIRPYQPYRRRLMVTPVANLLPQSIATGGDGTAAGPIPSTFYVNTPTAAITSTIVALGAGVAFEESNAFSFAIPSGQGVNSGIFNTDVQSVIPGQTYTFSLYVANNTASTTTRVLPYISWYNSSGSAVFGNGTGTDMVGAAGNPSWQRITVTATAPASCYGMRLGMNVGTTTAAASTILIDGLQLEKGSTATAWVNPGYWYSVFSGFVERFPSQYTDGGTRGEVVPTAVDAFALLAQRTLDDPLSEELRYLGPRFVYKLNDPAGSTLASDATGNNPGVPTVNGKSGAGSLVFGTSITATDTVNGVYAGSDTVCTISNWEPGTLAGTGGNTYGGATMLALDKAGIKGPANTSEWTRVIAFRYTGGTITDDARIWSAYDASNNNVGPNGANVDAWMNNTGVYLSTGGTLAPNGNSATFATSGTVNPADGNWHLAVFGMSVSGGKILASLDGATTGAVSATWNSANIPSGLSCDTLGGWRVASLGNLATFNFKGDLSFAAEFPYMLNSTQISGLYTAWRNQGMGESTGSRYARILRYAGYTGGTWLDTGNTASMGPASDITGADALSALQGVVDTESGSHWVQGSGTIRFRGRTARYNALTPVVVLGEGSGEIPYEDLQLDYDPTHLANIVTVTQTSTGQTFVAQDATSIANYMPRPLARTVNSTSALECQDAADYLLSRYKNPLPRVSAVKINLSGNPSAWASLMVLELGTRIRVMRRPSGAPAIQVDCFVEQMQWDFDDQGGAWLVLQCSPADTRPYGQFAAWHSTLNSPFSIGAGNVTIGPSADNTNPLAAQIGMGQQLVIDPGTAIAETVTVTQVGTTFSGWTSAFFNFTPNLAYNHASGAVVCEPLPSGATAPTAYDAAAAFDAISFAY